MTTHRDFFRAMIPLLGFEARLPAIRACAVVSIEESSMGDNHWNNPLAMEEPWPGATPYNDAGVMRYLTPEDGEKATAKRLSGTRWAPVRRAMRSADNRDAVLDAFSEVYATWGARINFAGLPFNNVPSIRHRLDHILEPYAPKDPWQ